jgi:hypothetical protein
LIANSAVVVSQWNTVANAPCTRWSYWRDRAAKALAIATGVITAFVTSYTARADTPNFPDFSAYTRANVDEYTVPVPNPGREPLGTVYFVANDGSITCDFVSAAGQCNFPATPAGPNGPNWIATDLGLKHTNGSIAPGNKIYGRRIKTLPPLHSITVNGVICGVNDAGTTACKDPQGRGFVLSPDDSGLLPYQCLGAKCAPAHLPSP